MCTHEPAELQGQCDNLSPETQTAGAGGGAAQPPSTTLANPGDEESPNPGDDEGAEEEGTGLTRVGRWMSPEEYQAMEDAGMVQPGRVSPQVSVAHPADIEAYMQQAAPGSRYVEFDVPENSLVPGGKEGWATIPGPDSIFSRLALQRGLPPYSYRSDGSAFSTPMHRLVSPGVVAFPATGGGGLPLMPDAWSKKKT
jgi:hypothetical protein